MRLIGVPGASFAVSGLPTLDEAARVAAVLNRQHAGSPLAGTENGSFLNAIDARAGELIQTLSYHMNESGSSEVKFQDRRPWPVKR